MPPLQISFIPLARPTFDIPLAREVTATARRLLVEAGFALTGPDDLVLDTAAAAVAADQLAAVEPDLLLIFQATFADSSMVVRLAEATGAPLLLWAIPETPTGGRLRLNSLCGVNLAGHALKLRHRKYAYAYAPPEDTAVLATIHTLAQAGRARRRLRQSRIGLVGEHPAGLDSCHLDAPVLRTTFGTEVVPVSLAAVLAGIGEMADTAVTTLYTDLRHKLPNLADLDPAPLRGTLSAYVLLNQLAQEQQFDGLAVRCWPEFFEERGCAACGALSLLNDAHLPSSCEADANGTVTQVMLQALSGSPTFDCDLVAVDADHDALVIWHCGKAPLAMADPETQPYGGLHSNRKVPLVMEFPLRPGIVTVARISREADGHLRLVIGRGEMIRARQSFSGTSGVLRFDRPAQAVLDTILREGLEHHLAITYGDYTDALQALAELLDLPVLEL
jgi:L-fucose isomerase-like protein